MRKRERPAAPSRDEVNLLDEKLKALLQPNEKSVAVTFEPQAPDNSSDMLASVRVTITPTDPKLEAVSGHAITLYDALFMARSKRFTRKGKDDG